MAAADVQQMEEQMRFNLRIPPNPTNMSTRFKLRPAPVVLHKIPPKPPPPPPSLSLDARMELATRLARRELETALLMKKATLPSSGSVSFHSPVKSTARPSPSDNSSLPVTMTTASNLRPQLKPSKGKKYNKIHLKGGVKHVTIAMTEEGDVNDVESVGEDIKRLQNELTQQLHCYRLSLPRPSRENEAVSKPDASSAEGRLEWIGEMNKESKREARRNKEQNVRNTRLLYELQQKVKDAERAMSQAREGVDIVKKAHAVQQLAVAHRAALRTLHSLANTASNGTNPKVTQQLVSLLELLSRVATQFGSRSEEAELLEALKELKESLNDHFFTLQSSSSAEERGKTYLKPSVISHAAKPLRNKGSLRQHSRPKSVLLKKTSFHVKATKPKHDGSKEREPFHFARGTRSSLIKRSPRKMEPSNQPTSPPPPPPPHPSSTSNTSATQKNSNSSHLEREVARHIWYNARMTESMRHLDTTQKETLDKLSRLEERVREMKERESALSPSPEKRREERGTQVTPLPPEMKSAVHGTLERKNEEGSPVANNEDNSKQLLDASAVNKMMQRLEEIEKEKSEIQRRWQSVSYHDPRTILKTPPPSPHLPVSSPSLHSSIPPLPPDAVNSILKYQELYKNYLKTTGIDTDGDFNPWAMVDSICDELLDEMLDEVINEVDDALESYVHQLFDSEFHKP